MEGPGGIASREPAYPDALQARVGILDRKLFWIRKTVLVGH